MAPQQRELDARPIVRLHIFLTTCVLTCLLSGVVHSNDEANQLIDLMVGEREMLYAGDFSLKGIQVQKTTVKDVIRTTSREINERIKFDFPQGLLWHEKELWSLAEVPIESPNHQVIVYGPEAAYRKSVEAKQIDVGQKGEPAGFFDPRIFGMCSIAALDHNTRLNRLSEAFRHAIDSGRLFVTKSDEAGIVIMTLNVSLDKDSESPKGPYTRRRIWIDTAGGYTPIRMEMQWNETYGTDAREPKWGTPFETGEADWKQIDGTWVPISANITLTQAIPNKQMSEARIYDLAFEWNLVNPEYPVSEFSLSKLDIPSGSHLIVDSRKNRSKPVIIQHPSVPNAED